MATGFDPLAWSRTGGDWGKGEFAATPVGNRLLESDANRRVAYDRYNYLGGSRPGSYGFAQRSSLFPQIDAMYNVGLSENPELTFQDFYSRIQPWINRQTAGMTNPNESRFVRPIRMIPRGVG